jgi:hypothetical protein
VCGCTCESACLTNKGSYSGADPQDGWPGYFYFKDVDSIAAFQLGLLRQYGAPDPDNWPQARISATEQGWPVRTAQALVVRL